jgi:hypothetical protein
VTLNCVLGTVSMTLWPCHGGSTMMTVGGSFYSRDDLLLQGFESSMSMQVRSPFVTRSPQKHNDTDSCMSNTI